MSTILSITNVTHRYDDLVALDDVSLEITAGERLALLGPNGGGKTTLFRLISTLLLPSEGTISVAGNRTDTASDAVRRSIGIVFQHNALDDVLTVRENMRTHAALLGVPKSQREERISLALDALNIHDRADDRVGKLSGGLARRTDLARCLLGQPAVLLLDEPTTGLDPIARKELWDALDQLRATTQTTQVVATHMMDEAERCDRVGILDRGKLVALGSPDELKAELGTKTLWLESGQPVVLQQQLESDLGLSSRLIGRQILVNCDEPAAILAQLYSAAGNLITQSAIRQPTLEDVFIAATGHSFQESVVGEQETVGKAKDQARAEVGGGL